MERSNKPRTNSTLRAKSIFIVLCVSLPRLSRMERVAGSSKQTRFYQAGEHSKGTVLAEGKTPLGCSAPAPHRGTCPSVLASVPTVPARQDSRALIVTSHLRGGCSFPPCSRQGLELEAEFLGSSDTRKVELSPCARQSCWAVSPSTAVTALLSTS